MNSPKARRSPLLAVELRRVHARDDAAVAGGDRVDEDEVGDVEQRVVVVDQPVRRRGLEPVVGHLHALRRERPHVQPDRRRAGAAVVEERDRPRLRVLAVLRVGDEEHPRRDLAVVEPDRQRAGGRGVLDVAAVETDRVRRLRDLLFGRTGGLLRGGGGDEEREREKHDDGGGSKKHEGDDTPAVRQGVPDRERALRQGGGGQPKGRAPDQRE